MNLQVAMNQAAKKSGDNLYLSVQARQVKKKLPQPELSWAYFDYIILGEVDE